MNEAARVREAQRTAALGGQDPGRLALSPAGREYLAAVAQQRAAAEAARLQAQKEEEARRAAAKSRIKSLKSKTKSGQEVAEKRLYNEARTFSANIQKLETQLAAAKQDLQEGYASGDDVKIRDAKARIASIEGGIRAARSDPRFQQALELARDLYYFSNPQGQLLLDENAGERISNVFDLSISNVFRRQERERRRADNAFDPSRLDWRLDYKKKYGVDPKDVKVIDNSGKEVSLTKLGRGYDVDAAKKIVDAQAQAKDTAIEEAKKTVEDQLIQKQKELIQQGIKPEGYRVTYDPKTGQVTGKLKIDENNYLTFDAQRNPEKYPNLFTITEQPVTGGNYVDPRMNVMFGTKPIGDWVNQIFESKVKSGEYKLDPKTGQYYSIQQSFSIDPFKQAADRYTLQQQEIGRQTSAAVQKWKEEQRELGYGAPTVAIYDKGKAPQSGYGGPTLLVDKGDKTYAYSVVPMAGRKQYEYRATDPTNPWKIEKVEIQKPSEEVKTVSELPPDDAFAGFANVYANMAKTYWAGFVNVFDPVQARQWQLRKETAPVIEREIVGDAITDIGVPTASKGLENLKTQIGGGKIDPGATRNLINESVTDYAAMVQSRPQYYFGSSLAEASMWINPFTLPAKIASVTTKGARTVVTVSEAISAASKSTKAVEAGELGFKSSGKIGSPEVFRAIQQERPVESLYKIWVNYENKPVTSTLARLFGQQSQKVAPVDIGDMVKVVKQYERAPTNRLDVTERPSVLGQREPIPIDEELGMVKLYPEEPVPKKLPSLDDIVKPSRPVRTEGAPFKPKLFPVEENAPFLDDIVKKMPPVMSQGAPFKPKLFPVEENVPFLEDIVKRTPPVQSQGAPFKDRLFPLEQGAPKLEDILRPPYKLAGTEVTELEARLGEVARAERAANDPRNILSRIKLPRSFVRTKTPPSRLTDDQMKDLLATMEGRERPGVARDYLTREQQGRLAGDDADLGISGFGKPKRKLTGSEPQKERLSLLERSLLIKKDPKTGELIFGNERIYAPRPVWAMFSSGKRSGSGTFPAGGAGGSKPPTGGAGAAAGSAGGGGPAKTLTVGTEGTELQPLYQSKQGIPPSGKPPTAPAASGRPGVGKAGRTDFANPLGLAKDLMNIGRTDRPSSGRDLSRKFDAEPMSSIRLDDILNVLSLQNVPQKPQSRPRVRTESGLDTLSLSVTLPQFQFRQQPRQDTLVAQAADFPTAPSRKPAVDFVRTPRFRVNLDFPWPPPPDKPPRRPPGILRGPDGDAKGKRGSSGVKYKTGEHRYKEADILALFFGNYFSKQARAASDYDAQDELIDYYMGRSS